MTQNGLLEVGIYGIGAIGPGFSSWPALKDLLTAQSLDLREKTQLPNLDILPPAERRRASPIIKAGINAGIEACLDAEMSPADLQTIFTSSGGDGANCIAICEQLATDDPLISPTRFHNSVHNTVAGYWGIATGCMRPSQAISAEDGSFGAGLLEAATQTIGSGLPTLLISYDTSYPEPLNTFRNISDTAAIALVIGLSAKKQSRYPALTMPFVGTNLLNHPSNMSVNNPTLQALDLLAMIANQCDGVSTLPFQPRGPLNVKVDFS
ncbi:MAG: beta-ketoacyl synthase chain length factor [Fluviibacter sp.]